jgi:Flp pilus assembly protein CpaB
MVLGGVGALVVVVLIFLALHLMRSPSEASNAPKMMEPQVLRTEILVPIETVAVGVALQPTMFRKELKNEESVTGDMIRGFEELKGMYARGVLIKNQPIFKGALTNRQPVHVLTAMIPKNYRALAIQVETPFLDNVDGWAQPGTDVDVVWLTGVFGKETAAVLAGPVRILASNKATEWSPVKTTPNQGDRLVTVTLLVTARDAARISLASLNGKISLGLRGLADKRPNEGSRPISNVVEDPAAKSRLGSLLSVKIIDPKSRGTELRKYDHTGRRVAD